MHDTFTMMGVYCVFGAFAAFAGLLGWAISRQRIKTLCDA